LEDNLSLQIDGAKIGFVLFIGRSVGDGVPDHIEQLIGIGLEKLEVLSLAVGLKVSVEVSVEVCTEEERRS
jgi:hypothetical protein